ncbi:MAG: AtpZ/AtpI family protein [Roseivirga sp.]
MMATIAVSAWAGRQLDGYFQLEFPWFLCLLTVVGTLVMLYTTIRRLV